MSSLETTNPDSLNHDEAHFKRYFPYTPRLSCFTAKQQFELLQRAYLLCVKSNRRNEIKINQRFPDQTIVARRSDGSCTHPIFITQLAFKTQREDLREPAFLYKLLFKNSMLVNRKISKLETSTVERHPTYCEEFRHGDLLKLVVPDEFQAETNRYRLAAPFEESEGVFVWWLTKEHPTGYPYIFDSESDKTLFDFEI